MQYSWDCFDRMQKTQILNNKYSEDNKQMKRNDKLKEISSQMNEKIDYHCCESQALLLFESRQIVHHMLIIEDWIILAIQTPHSQINNTKSTFSKVKQNHQFTIPNQNQSPKQHLQSITRFVSVMAIRIVEEILDNSFREYKMFKKHVQSMRNLSQQNRKSSIGEIKMLHKECRLQNILPWTVPNYVLLSPTQINKTSTFAVGIDKKSINNQLQFQQDFNSSNTDTKYFVLLTYIRIELYAVESISQNLTAIKLVRIFQTPFLIPFNVVWLKNQNKTTQTKKTLNRLPNKAKTNVSFQIRFKPHATLQPFQIAISGIDRSQTFWSGYYQIQNHKRNIYLFRDFFLRPKQVSESRKVQQSFKSPQAKLRRVKSAENIFNFKNNLSPGRQNKLTSTGHLTKQSLTSNKQSSLFQNKQSSLFQNKSPSIKEDLSKRLFEYKQPLPSQFLSRMQNRKSPKKQESQKMIPKELQYDEKMEIYPKFITLSKQVNDDRNSLCPALQHFSHFYMQTTHHNNNLDIKTHKHVQINKSHNKVRRKFELFILGCYANSIALINCARKELISKVELQPAVSIISMIRIESLFGIHSVVVLVKDFYNQSQKGKVIKVTVDNISKDKLGIGLEKLKIPTISSFEQVTYIDNIWQQALIDQLNGIIDQCEDENGELHFFNGSFEVDKDLIKQSTVEDDSQEHTKHDLHQHHEVDNLISNFSHWRGIPLTEMKYNLLMVTDKGRVLLYNHIRSSVQQIYSSQLPIQPHNNPSSLNNISQVHASKFYLHFKQATNSQQQQNFSLQLRLKLAAIFNKQVVAQGIKRSIPSKSKQQQKVHNVFPVAQLKQLKQILLLDNHPM